VTSWNDGTVHDRDRHDWLGSVALALAVPALFFGLYFGLDFALQWIAGLFA
jgi:hypothetical protein